MITSPDSFSEQHLQQIVSRFALDLVVMPLRSQECLVCVPGEEFWRGVRDEVADWAHVNDLPQVAKHVKRAIIPRGHVLVVGIGADVRIFTTAVDDPNASTDHDDESDDALVTRRASAVGVLGLLGGGSTR